MARPLTLPHILKPPKQAVASTRNPARGTATTGAVLVPGRYLIVPNSTDCITNTGACPQRPSDDLTCNSGTHVTGKGYEGGEEEGFTTKVEAMLSEMFESLDADCDGVLCREEVRVQRIRRKRRANCVHLASLGWSRATAFRNGVNV